MKQATIRSVCECQAQLEARLDEHRFVLAGFAIGTDRVRERAPAHSIEPQLKRFDVGWLCPICGRNTLRSFDAEALSFRDEEIPAATGTMPVQPAAPLGPGPATGLASMAAPPMMAKPAAAVSASRAPLAGASGGSVAQKPAGSIPPAGAPRQPMPSVPPAGAPRQAMPSVPPAGAPRQPMPSVPPAAGTPSAAPKPATATPSAAPAGASPSAAPKPAGTGTSPSQPPSAATAVALKSLTTPSKPPSQYPKLPSSPPEGGQKTKPWGIPAVPAAPAVPSISSAPGPAPSTPPKAPSTPPAADPGGSDSEKKGN